jgi:hypothetical protein
LKLRSRTLNWLFWAKPIADLLKSKLNLYWSQGKSKLCAPKVTGKSALFSALILDRIQVLMKKFLLEKLRQYFEHFGFSVGGEW